MNEYHEKRADMVKGLRALADMIEQGAFLPYDIRADVFSSTVDFDTVTVEHARAAMAAFPGNWDKTYLGNYVVYGRALSETVTYEMNIPRDTVCTRVPVGTKHVPASEAHDEVVYEWKCDDDE